MIKPKLLNDEKDIVIHSYEINKFRISMVKHSKISGTLVGFDEQKLVDCEPVYHQEKHRRQ